MLNSLTVWAVPAGTVISNTATVDYRFGASSLVSTSNTVVTTTLVSQTPATLFVRRFDPSAAALPVQQTAFDNGSGFVVLPPPVPFGSSVPVNLGVPVPLRDASLFHVRDPVFVAVADADQNRDPLVAETIDIVIQVQENGDTEVLRLTEIGVNSGIFSGYVMTTNAAVVSQDGVLSVAPGNTIRVRYTDPDDSTDTVANVALIDPAGIVFNSRTGQPVDGATVTLIDAGTGLPATVLGDDGTSTFPASVVTGSTVTDGGGTVYNFTAGQYRFPLVAAGDYRLEVTPPAGYAFPTVRSDAQIQLLPGAPFNVATGSRGETVTIASGPPVLVDVPIDPANTGAFLSKSANKSLLAIGDFVEWQLRFSNADSTLPAENIRIEDTLPTGFRYRKGSLRVDGKPVADPVIARNGRQMTITLGSVAASATADIRYVTEVVPGAPMGQAVNLATALGDYGLKTNRAQASVMVRDDFFRQEAFLVGRVVQGSCETAGAKGVEGARIYLEDGTYVVTDADGQWHIEGVKPGSHVVQLDKASLPSGYEVVPCAQDTRHAGRSFSQFVDVKGGSLRRADFFVRQAAIEVAQKLSGETVNGQWQTVWELRGNESATNLRAMVAIPEGWHYLPGTTTIDGVAADDPAVMGNTLVYRLGDVHGPWLRRIVLRSNHTGEALGNGEIHTMAVANLGGQFNQRIEPMALPLAGKGAVPVETRQDFERAAPGANAARETPQREEYAIFDDAWLASADGQFDWVYPTPGFNPSIPSLRVGIKHAPGQTVQLFVNGKPADAIDFDGFTDNARKTASISRWRGLDLKLGDNHFEAILLDADGHEIRRLTHDVHYSDAPYRAEFLPDQSQLQADGRSNPLIAVRFTDRYGYPARPGVLGKFTVAAPYVAAQSAADARKGRVVRASQQPVYQIGEDGIAYLSLDPTSQTGEALLTVDLDEQRTEEIRAWLKPAAREWILVGLAEGSLGEHMVSGDALSTARAGLDSGSYTDGRAAFFAKGAIKGEWILTAAYDTGKDNGDRFKQIIDPDTYYTLYGDDTQQGYDAASSRKLYLKLERDRFYAMFGDYDTGLTVTEYSRYSRSLTGLKSEYQGDRFKYNLFASETGQQYIRDELRGDGTSGLYRLSRTDLLENSEKITIETRDRFHSEKVVASQSMTRHIDYNIDYANGTIFFRQPVLSRDAALNPVYIVVEYETKGKNSHDITGGGRVAMLLGEGSELGVSAIHEGNEGARADLVGADLTLKLTDAVTLKAETASTDREVAGGNKQGDAYRVELEHDGEKLDAAAYFRDQTEGFGLGQQAASEAGTRKYGVDLRYDFTQVLSLDTEAYRQENRIDNATRDVVDTKLQQRNDGSMSYVGARYAGDKRSNGDTFQSTQLLLGGSEDLLDKKITLHADAEILVDKQGKAENPDFPHRLILGLDYHLSEAIDLLLDQEFTWGDNVNTQSTIAGVRTRPWQGAEVLTSVGQETGENGDRVFSNMGLTQNLVLNEQWHADFSLDRSQTLSQSAQSNQPLDSRVPPASGSRTPAEDFSAVSAALAYSTAVEEWAGRVEYRESKTTDKWNFFTGYLRELREGLAMSLGATYSDEQGLGNVRDISSDLRYSVAWRPLDDGWTLFNRLDYLYDRQDDALSNTRSRRLVNNLLANYKPDWRSQLNFQWGMKYVLDNLGGKEYDGYTDLYGAEYRYNLSPEWDVGMQASTLNNWDAGIHQYSYGVSVGASLRANTWISVGYNVDGFQDADFAGSDYTAKGFYLKFRMKFDQETIRDMWKENGLR